MAEPLEDVQDSVLERLHAGEAVDRDAVLAAHPEHAEALRRFFTLLDEIEAPPSPEPARPARLGEFHILRELGRGGMGIVYEAEQASLKRRVALKVLPASLAQHPRIVARFRREAEAAGRLRHPGIVPVFSVGEEKGTPFFAMERVEGRSLADVVRVRSGGGDAGLPAAGEPWRRWCVETVARVADALHYAHGQGILHRDVKPGNILLEADGTPRLTDFGLALDLGAPGLTTAGETFGTPLYMSPEQALRREQPLDPRTDVYSLGVTLYEVLALRPPYEASTAVEVFAALRNGNIVPPRQADPAMPEALETVLLRALQRDPAARYTTAAAFAEDLRAVLAGRAAAPPASPPASPPAAAPRPRRHRRIALAVACCSAVAAMLFAGGRSAGWFAGRRRAEERITLEQVQAIAMKHADPGEDFLRRLVLPDVRLRRVVSRKEPGSFGLGFTCATASGLGGSDVAALCLWEARVDDGPWRELSSFASQFGGGAGDTRPLGELLGDALSKPSVKVQFRARVRLLPIPKGTWPSTPASPEILAAPFGAEFTWADSRTVFVYDEFPADYPEAVRLPGPVDQVDMLRAMVPVAAYQPSLYAGPPRSLGLTLVFRGGPIPLPAAFEVDLVSPWDRSVVATGTYTCDAEPSRAPGGYRTMHFPFFLHEPPSAEEQKFLLEVTSGSLKVLHVVFRPSRQVALDCTDFDRYWARGFDAEVYVYPGFFAGDAAALPEAPVSVIADAGEKPGPGERVARVVGDPGEMVGAGPQTAPKAPTAAPPGEGPVAASPPPAPSTIARLAAGTLPNAQAVFQRMVHASVRMRPLLARRDGGRYEMRVRLDGAEGLEKEDACVLVRWEASIDEGPWKDLGIVQEIDLDGGTVLAPGWVRDISGTAFQKAQLDVQHRATVRIVPRRFEAGESRIVGTPKNGEDRWAVPGGTTVTWTDRRTEYLYPDYPAEYPVKVADAATDAAMEASLRPKRVLGISIGGGARRSLQMTLDLPTPGPVPAAFDVDLLLPGDDRVLATTTFARAAGSGPEPEAQYFEGLLFVLPDVPPADESTWLLALTSGGAKQVRLVFRPSRDVALGVPDFDRYWDKGLEVTVPVK